MEPGDRPRNRFAFFGQLNPYKGADVLLRAMDVLGEDFDGAAVDLRRQSRDPAAGVRQERFADAAATSAPTSRSPAPTTVRTSES